MTRKRVVIHKRILALATIILMALPACCHCRYCISYEDSLEVSKVYSQTENSAPLETTVDTLQTKVVLPKDSSGRAASFFELAPADNKKTRSSKKLKQPVGSVKAGIGPMWTTSKLYIENDKDYESDVRGTGIGVSATSIRWGCVGFGVDFYASHTSINHTFKSYGYDKKYSFTQLYIGPSFVCGGVLFSRLRGETSFGLGLAAYSEKGNADAGLGIRVSLGLEFMITQKIGIGIEGVSQKHIFKKPKGYNVSNDEQYGFLQQGLLFGLRTYL